MCNKNSAYLIPQNSKVINATDEPSPSHDVAEISNQKFIDLIPQNLEAINPTPTIDAGVRHHIAYLNEYAALATKKEHIPLPPEPKISSQRFMVDCCNARRAASSPR